jgi:transcriptional regulator GlxA family with amidase domain
MPSSSPRLHSARPLKTLVFLLVEGFSMMSLASAIEPLRSCNRLMGGESYAWRLAGPRSGTVHASNGIAFDTKAVDDALEGADALFVCGGLRIDPQKEKTYLAGLRRAARSGIVLGALSTGGYLLARAGLLRGYRCTIHWENRPAFREEFGDLDCSDRIYEIDRDRLTCSGGTAAMDLMLWMITQDHGVEVAQRVAHQFHHDHIRGQESIQPGSRADQRSGYPSVLRSAVSSMEAKLETPLDIEDIAQDAGISTRQLERLFQRHTGLSPIRYYIALRAERARELLMYSDRPVLDVAIATGFNSNSHMAYWFKTLYGARPTEVRRQALST